MGRLMKALYGTRDAPQLWAAELKKVMAGLGFTPSLLHPGIFQHNVRGVLVVAHVDDLLMAGPEIELEWTRTQLHNIFEIKGSMLSKTNPVKYLGRLITETDEGFTWEADTKHVNILIDELGLRGANGTKVPLSADDRPVHDEDRAPLDVQAATMFRRCAARLNYLCQDRPDIGISSNLLSRSMSCPREGDELMVKKVARYLIFHPVCRLTFPWQNDPKAITVMTDSDWAGCRRTRRSTSGTAIFLGKHLLSFSSKIQKSVALSSGEAELNAQVLGISEGIGMQRLCREWGCEVLLASRCDSSAARGTLLRQGLGKMKHLELKHLWTQELVARGKVSIKCIPRADNPADVLTHTVSRSELERLLGLMGIEFPTATTAGGSLAEGGCWGSTVPSPTSCTAATLWYKCPV